MTQWVELDPAVHRSLRVATHVSATFGDNVGVVSALPCEFPMLLAHYPIVFRKSAQSGQFEPAVLLGFEKHENLFLRDERWDAEYVPLQVQRQPFTVLPPREGSPADQARIAFDADSPRIVSGDRVPQSAQAVFMQDGQPSVYLQRLAGMLRSFAAGAVEAVDFAQYLAQAELLEPLRIKVQFVDRSKVELQGLYTVKSEALDSLPGATLIALRDRGFLRSAYYQVASLAQLGGLVARRNRILTGMSA